MKLSGKVALVTGGGGGIGEGISLALAREGAIVVINYCRNAEGARKVLGRMKKNGQQGYIIKADISDLDQIKEMVKDVISKFKRIDILVNNSGIAPYCRCLDICEADWDETLNVNLKGSFFCSQLVAKEMIKRKIKGKIINISSVGGFLAHKGLTHYDVSKAGLNMLTKNMALELAPYGINVNAIAPGAIEVERNRQSLRSPAYIHKWKEIIPLGRWGQPADVAGTVVFFASSDADFITGQSIYIDGGQTIQLPQPEYNFAKFEKCLPIE